MKNTLFPFLFFLFFSGLSAQTYFYLDTVILLPPAPTVVDEITVQIKGNKATPCVFLDSMESAEPPPFYEFTFYWADTTGVCILVLEPWDTTLILPPLPEGEHCVEVNHVSPGSADSALVCFEVSGANNSVEVSPGGGFYFYPNPAAGTLYWHRSGFWTGRANLRISDLSGREVWYLKNVGSSGKIDVQAWPPGWYVAGVEGNERDIQSFIVRIK